MNTFTSLAICLRISIISEKLGLWLGSCSQHLSSSSLSLGWVCLGIVGRRFCKMILIKQMILIISTIRECFRFIYTFCTTATAACNGVRRPYGSWHFESIHTSKRNIYNLKLTINALLMKSSLHTDNNAQLKSLTSPVSISQSDIPKLKTSALWSYGLCSITYSK